jgi:protein-disulfide isomerase
MKTAVITPIVLPFCILMACCSNYVDTPVMTLTGVDGTVIELNANTPITAVFFFSMSNPVALGAFNSLPENLGDAVDNVAIAMHVDRPPNVYTMQQRTLIPIVIDENGRIAKAFGGINLTPSLMLIDKGRILLHQRGQLDYQATNAIIGGQR